MGFEEIIDEEERRRRQHGTFGTSTVDDGASSSWDAMQHPMRKPRIQEMNSQGKPKSNRLNDRSFCRMRPPSVLHDPYVS